MRLKSLQPNAKEIHTMAVKKTYKAGVKEYRETYWMPNYTPSETDILACFKVTPQPGVPNEEAAAAVAAESSTGTWTTVWTDLLTDLDYYKGRANRLELVAEAIYKPQQETGERKGHYLNVTAPDPEAMYERAEFAKELGMPIIMHDFLTAGFTANTGLAKWCRKNGMLLHIHRAMHAVIDRHPK